MSKNIIVCIISSNQVLSLFVFFVPTVLSILHTLTVPPGGPGGPRTSHSITELLSAPAFAFCFSFLRLVLKDGGKAVGGDEDLRYQALQVVAEHCSLRAGDNQEEDDKENKEVPKRLHTLR